MDQQGDNFRVLKIYHLALLGGITFFAIIAVIMVITKTIPPLNNNSIEQILQAITAVVSLAALLVGFNLFKRRITQARSATGTAEERMNQYRTACVTWWALIEGPGIFAVIGLYLTGNFAFLALALFHIVILAVFMPRKENIIVLLNLTTDEVARLEGRKVH